MKKWIVIVLLVIGAGGYYAWRSSQAPAGPSFREVAVVRGDIRVVIVATGVVEPQNRVELNSPVAGRLEEVLVHEGDRVTRGQILAWISSTERATLLDTARARSDEEYARWQELYKPAPLIAPVDGEIIARKLEPGQSVSSEKPILVMSDHLVVKASVDETDIARIQKEQAAEIELDAYPNDAIPGRVAHIAYEAETVNNVTTYKIDVLPGQPPEFLRSGMTANVTFIAATTNGVLSLAAEAIAEREGKPTVKVAPLAPDGEPRVITIKTGLTDGKNTEVLEGLKEGDTVLVPALAGMAQEGGKGNPLVPFRGMGRRR